MTRKCLLGSIILLAFFYSTCPLWAEGIQELKFKKDFSSINAVLGIRLEQLLRDFYPEETRNGAQEKIREMEYKAMRVNFSRHKGRSDYLVKANIYTDWWKVNATVLLAYVRIENSYRLTFKWIGFNKNFDVHPVLIDVDPDGKKEFLLETDGSRNQSTAVKVTVWRYNGERFVPVFQQGVEEGYALFPYAYGNSYAFVKNEKNSKLMDIRYRIRTEVDKTLLPEYRKTGGNVEMPKPFQDEIRFHFNGKVYVPNKPVYDYRKPLRQFLEN
jgi:hypothetical protein